MTQQQKGLLKIKYPRALERRTKSFLPQILLCARSTAVHRSDTPGHHLSHCLSSSLAVTSNNSLSPHNQRGALGAGRGTLGLDWVQSDCRGGLPVPDTWCGASSIPIRQRTHSEGHHGLYPRAALLSKRKSSACCCYMPAHTKPPRKRYPRQIIK